MLAVKMFTVHVWHSSTNAHCNGEFSIQVSSRHCTCTTRTHHDLKHESMLFILYSRKISISLILYSDVNNDIAKSQTIGIYKRIIALHNIVFNVKYQYHMLLATKTITFLAATLKYSVRMYDGQSHLILLFQIFFAIVALRENLISLRSRNPEWRN